ncbi:anoctamin-7 isoform X2 [Prionailurus iriomotensis]
MTQAQLSPTAGASGGNPAALPPFVCLGPFDPPRYQVPDADSTAHQLLCSCWACWRCWHKIGLLLCLGTVFFSIFMSLWATAFLEHRKCKSITLVHHWDRSDFQEEESSSSWFPAGTPSLLCSTTGWRSDSDTHKFAVECPPPVAKRAQDIGICLLPLEAPAHLLVTMNAFLLVAFTSDLTRLLYEYEHYSLLHAVFSVRLLAWLVPDVPAALVAKVKREALSGRAGACGRPGVAAFGPRC